MFIINNWRQASTPPLRLGGAAERKKRPDTRAYLGGGICLAK